MTSPCPSQAIHFAPVLFPAELEKNLVRLREELVEAGFLRQELDFREPPNECPMTRGFILARTIFTQQIDLIDEHVAICAAQKIFRFRDRDPLENFGAGRAQEFEQDVEPGTLLQLQPRPPGIIVKCTRAEMRKAVVMRNP